MIYASMGVKGNKNLKMQTIKVKYWLKEKKRLRRRLYGKS